MLDYNLQIKGAPILSLHSGSPIGTVVKPIMVPGLLQIAGLFVSSPLLNKKESYILQSNAIRELSRHGIVINSIDDVSPADDLLRFKELIEINFDLLECRVKTKSGTRLGSVTNYILDGLLMVRQIVVKPSMLKSLSTTPLFIPRTAILEIKDRDIIVADTTKQIAMTKLPAKLDPDFVNPFAGKSKPREA
ncbi:hypothetical protein FWH09_03440 [Candidatus Saccharibacteria bacterium]|nr:hypothetical protein [Candidatus Saccharibacteria bacterium]